MKDLEKRFAKSLSYIESQGTRGEKGHKKGSRGPAITMSRETGAGAVTLADKLAARLDELLPGAPWTVFDKNLVAKVLEDHNLPQRLEQFMPEDSPKYVTDAVGDMLGIHPPSWSLVRRTNDTIYRLARLGRCILVGRGANIITRELPNVVHIRLVGSLEGRIRRCAEYYDIGKAAARELIKKQDRARRRYLLAYLDEDIDDPKNYDVVINVDRMSQDAIVDLIASMIPIPSKSKH